MTKLERRLLFNGKINLPKFVGLFLALFGINLIGELFKLFNISANSFLGQILVSDLKKWFLAAIIIIIVISWEKRPLRSIGIKKTDTKTVILAIVFGVISVVVGILFLGILYSLLGLKQPNMLSLVGELPLAIKLLTITTAAITEELFYRGYSLERLGGISDSFLLAGFITGLIFLAIHFPAWGLAGAIPQFVFTISLISFYLYKRNLIGCIIMHWTINFLMLIVLPTLA